MMKLLINSIYKATEGEGIHIGTPQIFIRFQGCTVGCLNCDSTDTWDFDQANEMSLESVLDEVYSIAGNYPHQLKRLSITGGDPLHPKHVPAVLELVKRFKRDGFYINLEAAGTRVIDEIFDSIDFISFDFKTPSTGVKTNPELIIKLAKQYQNKFQIKSVVADERDFDAAYAAYNFVAERVTRETQIPWVITPCYDLGEDFPKERFSEIISLNEKVGGLFRVIGQQHKWIHGPDKKQI
jgi:7-carboxy-7-deazaguanine synthase